MSDIDIIEQDGDEVLWRYAGLDGSSYVNDDGKAIDAVLCEGDFLLTPRADRRIKRAVAEWVAEVGGGRPMFISDNNGFDWQFVNWYFHHFLGNNPFGHSSTNLGSLYKGVAKDMFVNFKHLRKTKHTHHPVDDARGNAEALLRIKEEYGLKISLK